MSTIVQPGDGADMIHSSTTTCITMITGLIMVDFSDMVGIILGTFIADGEDLIGLGDGTEIRISSILIATMLGDGAMTLMYTTTRTGTVFIEET